jgi:hypothetical protein
MGIYKIDGMGIKTSVFTILISLFATFYFGNSFVFLGLSKEKSIGGNATTLKYSYYVNIAAFVLSLMIFGYTFVMTYFFQKLLNTTTYNSNMFKVLGMFIFSLFCAVTVFINVQIFDTARKTYADESIKKLYLGMLYYSIFAGVFVIIYLFYYVYNNILRMNTYFKNIMVKVNIDKKKSEKNPVSDDDDIASVTNLSKFREIALKKRSKNVPVTTQSIDPFDENDEFTVEE